MYIAQRYVLAHTRIRVRTLSYSSASTRPLKRYWTEIVFVSHILALKLQCAKNEMINRKHRIERALFWPESGYRTISYYIFGFNFPLISPFLSVFTVSIRSNQQTDLWKKNNCCFLFCWWWWWSLMSSTIFFSLLLLSTDINDWFDWCVCVCLKHHDNVPNLNR